MKLARAIQANRGVECWYRGKLLCVVKAMANSMQIHVRAVYRHDSSMGHAQDAPDRSVLLRRALSKWGKLWTRKLDKLSLDLSLAFSDRSFKATQSAMRASFKEAGLTVKFKPTRASREAYRAVAAEQVNLIRSIPQKFLSDVQSSVWSSVMKGADQSALYRDIRTKYGIAARRAKLIARDQNHKATAVLENVRRMELGITEAVWRHSGAGKEPRPEHVAASGKRYKLKEGMFLEGKWTYPGMEINCRCTSNAVIPGADL